MNLLTAPSQAAGEIRKALNLPEGTVAMTFSLRAGEAARVTAEFHATQDAAGALAEVFKRYVLIEPAELHALRDTVARQSHVIRQLELLVNRLEARP